MPARPAVKGLRPAADAILRPQSLTDAVYDAVLDKLLWLEIGPEERIGVDDLARTLQVSQTPVREALTRLEGQGLVTKIQHVGYLAAPQLSRGEFEQLYDARVLLEPHVAGCAARLITKSEIDRLQRMLDELQGLKPKDRNIVLRAAQADSEFHRTIAAASGNEVIARILESLQIRVQFAMLRRRLETFDKRPALDEHRQILGALRERDARSAATLMREHLSASRHRYWPLNEGADAMSRKPPIRRKAARP